MAKPIAIHVPRCGKACPDLRSFLIFSFNVRCIIYTNSGTPIQTLNRSVRSVVKRWCIYFRSPAIAPQLCCIAAHGSHPCSTARCWELTDAAPQNQAPRCLLAWVNPRIGWLIYPLCLRSPRTIGAMSSQGLQLKSGPQIAAPKTLQPCCVVRAYFLKRTVRSIGASLQVTLPVSSAQLSQHLKDPRPLQAKSIAPRHRQKPQSERLSSASLEFVPGAFQISDQWTASKMRRAPSRTPRNIEMDRLV